MTGEQEPSAYWTEDRDLGTLSFGHRVHPVRARSRLEQETFRGRGSETLFTLTDREGSRAYLQSQLYTHPDAARRPEMRLADAQAWYYPADRTLVLWELVLAPPFARQPDPREDLLLRSLWLAYERLLQDHFPTADQVLTTWEDIYPQDQWRGFLSAVGYHPQEFGVFAKRLLPTGGSR